MWQSRIQPYATYVVRTRIQVSTAWGAEFPAPQAAVAEVANLVEAAVPKLTYPTRIEFIGSGGMYLAELGFAHDAFAVKPRILRVSADGKLKAVVQNQLL